jgi:cell division septum initiation protein DivIVA
MVSMMDITALLDRLEALVNDGWRMPLTNKTGIDEDLFFEIIDQLRQSIPQELKQASELLDDRERTLSSATEEAQRIVEQARAEASALVDRNEIMTAARNEAKTIEARAQREADEIRRGADDYAMGVLTELESRITSVLRTTSNGLVALKRRRSVPEEENPPAAT